ncbi:MAG: NADPH-dependent 7-cyano-7-deazaguanine reductase QueF [Gammaproteobacteria bacterium]|nr:NADPH-dependent 7-cyano-7-deazaguanine reductase QueF [Gammaproteobacteria bacterium]
MESATSIDSAAIELIAISRTEQREKTIGSDSLDGFGADTWRTSELTWLDVRGKPKRGDLTLTVPCDSTNMVESKSLKLFLMAFAMVQFNSKHEVEDAIGQHLSALLEAECIVDVNTTSSGFTFDDEYIEQSHRIDYVTLGTSSFEVNRDLLAPRRSASRVSGRYHTDLFRCLCPVSAQPDYATIVVTLQNAWFSVESLLAYLVSYRTHQGFHESTIEQIYWDINEVCSPRSLSVLGSFARRGGIDICPFRSSIEEETPVWRSNIS